MNELQLIYARAKANHQHASAMAKVEVMEKCGQLLEKRGTWTDAELEEYCEKECQIEDKHGVWQAFEAVIIAEQQMVKWAIEKLKGSPKFSYHSAMLYPLLENWQKSPMIREKMVDLCFHLKDEVTIPGRTSFQGLTAEQTEQNLKRLAK